MGLTLTVDTGVLDGLIDGLGQKLHDYRMQVAQEIADDWAANVEASETAQDPPDQLDYDENIVVDDTDDDTTTVYTEIPWAPAQEYGTAFTPPRPSATQAAEAHRSEFEQGVRGLLP